MPCDLYPLSLLLSPAESMGRDQMQLAHQCILSTEPGAWHMVDVQYISVERMNEQDCED